jgi:hypothetical protein
MVITADLIACNTYLKCSLNKMRFIVVFKKCPVYLGFTSVNLNHRSIDMNPAELLQCGISQ